MKGELRLLRIAAAETNKLLSQMTARLSTLIGLAGSSYAEQSHGKRLAEHEQALVVQSMLRQAVERVDGTLKLTVRTRDGAWLAGLHEREVERIGRR